MIACDTNLLVYAARGDSPWHERAAALLDQLAAGPEHWGLPWPCVHEFLSVITNARLFPMPTPAARAWELVVAWQTAPNLRLLSETAGYAAALEHALFESRATGPLVHDAHIAALCQVHGARELWTADRDFSRFPSLRWRNPLVG